MDDQPDINSTVATAVAAIRKAARLMGAPDNGIDSAQIHSLRAAIDELELVLNEKKRGIDAEQVDPE